MYRFFFSLRFRLILLVLLAVIPALGVTFYSGLEQRRIVAAQAKEEALRLAKLASTHQSQLIEGSRHFLYMLAQLSQVQNCDPASCSSLFANLLKQYPWYLNIGAVHPDGKIYASALPLAQPVNIADRPYFQVALKTRKFAIGDYQIGRITGKPAVNFGYPVLDENGKVKAVVFVAFCLDWLNQLSASANLPSGSTITVINHNGMILAHHPDSNKWVGKTLTESSIIKAVLSQKEGMVEDVGIDGVLRLYAFTEFAGSGRAGNIYLSIGIPTSVAFAQVDRILKRNILLLVVIGLIALAAIWVGGDLLVLRRLKPIMSAARQVGAGDLSVRTGIAYGKGELSQLALTFDQMVRSLEQREFEREKAEEALRSSEKRYRELANQLPEVVFETDDKGHLTFANQQAFDVFGYTQNDFDQGLAVFQMVAPEERQKAKQSFLKPLHGEELSTEYTMQKKDRSTFYAMILSAPIMCEGSQMGLRGIVVDITGRKQTEEVLRSEREKLELVTQNIAVGLAFISKDYRTLWANNVLKGIFGDVEGKPCYTTYNQRAEICPECGVREVFEKGSEKVIHEQVGKDIDGNTIWSEIIATPIKDKDGNITAALEMVIPITERKRAEESLKQSEENARQLAQENAIMAEIGRIISSTLNIDEIYESFSEEVKKIISFDRIVIDMIDTEKSTVKNVYIAGEGVQDRNVKDVYPFEGSGNAEMVRTKLTLLIQTEDFNDYKDRFPMLLSTFQAGFRSIMNVPLFSKGKIIGGLLLRSRKPDAYMDKDVRLAERIGSQIAGAVANAQLYTERIQAEKERAALEEQLRQSQKMEAIGRLAGGVAHDFNNSLTVIKGYSQLSLTGLKKNDPLRPDIEEIQKAAERAANLTRQLLAFSRRQILDMKVLDLNNILRELDKMLRRIIGEDIELVTLFTEDLGTVKTDPGQMEQVIMNLAVNARDAMPNGGKLTVETANVILDQEYARKHIAVKPGNYIMLSVSDTGSGMTHEVKERIFEPFFTTKEKGKGTGLGLSTVYGIVKQSGGNIWVYSEPGQGTTFKIYLPRVDEPLEQLDKATRTEEIPQGNETILIVEDDEAVRKLAVRVLEKQGYTVLEAQQGNEALKVCQQRKEPFHLILVDVVMPDISGRQLVDSLKQVWGDFKVLYMSGYTDNAIVHHGVLEKGVNYLQKPFTFDGLARKVREVLDK